MAWTKLKWATEKKQTIVLIYIHNIYIYVHQYIYIYYYYNAQIFHK